MRTFKKAKEIFNSQITKPSNENILSFKENKTSLNRFSSTFRLYKSYLYNKLVQRRLKKLSLVSFSKTTKINKNLYQLFLRVYKVSNPFQRQNLIRKKILKNYFFNKNSFNSLNSSRKFQNLLTKINFIIFSYFFEYKISSLLKLRKYYSLLKNENDLVLENLKNSKIILKIKTKLKAFILELRKSVEKLFINSRWSNKLLSNVIQRVQMVFCIYSIAFIILLCNSFWCTANYTKLEQTVRIALNKVNNNISFLTPNEKKLKLFLDFIQTIKMYSPMFLIVYISLFLKPKTSIQLPKASLGHLGVCAVIGLMNFGAEFSQSLINYILKSSILFVDIYFSQIFIKTGHKLIFLSDYTNLLTSRLSLINYRKARLFKQFLTFDIDRSFLKSVNRDSYSLGRYEQFIEEIFCGSNSFVKSYMLLPFYLILLTTLVYNCSYYIIYNKQPYIPIVTDLVKKLTPNNQND